MKTKRYLPVFIIANNVRESGERDVTDCRVFVATDSRVDVNRTQQVLFAALDSRVEQTITKTKNMYTKNPLKIKYLKYVVLERQRRVVNVRNAQMFMIAYWKIDTDSASRSSMRAAQGMQERKLVSCNEN